VKDADFALGKMDPTQSYKINKEIVYREEDDGAFLFDPDSGNLKYLNPTGKETFLMLEDETGIGEVTHRMHTEYPDVDPEQVRRDVEAFVEQLEENGFVSPQDGE